MVASDESISDDDLGIVEKFKRRMNAKLRAWRKGAQRRRGFVKAQLIEGKAEPDARARVVLDPGEPRASPRFWIFCLISITRAYAASRSSTFRCGAVVVDLEINNRLRTCSFRGSARTTRKSS